MGGFPLLRLLGGLGRRRLILLHLLEFVFVELAVAVGIILGEQLAVFLRPRVLVGFHLRQFVLVEHAVAVRVVFLEGLLELFRFARLGLGRRVLPGLRFLLGAQLPIL